MVEVSDKRLLAREYGEVSRALAKAGQFKKHFFWYGGL